MMKMVRDWNLLQCSDSDEKHRICVSLELEKPEKHPLEFAELCDVLFIGKVYAEEVLQANNMEDAIRKAHTMIRNKKYNMDKIAQNIQLSLYNPQIKIAVLN